MIWGRKLGSQKTVAAEAQRLQMVLKNSAISTSRRFDFILLKSVVHQVLPYSQYLHW